MRKLFVLFGLGLLFINITISQYKNNSSLRLSHLQAFAADGVEACVTHGFFYPTGAQMWAWNYCYDGTGKKCGVYNSCHSTDIQSSCQVTECSN